MLEATEREWSNSFMYGGLYVVLVYLKKIPSWWKFYKGNLTGKVIELMNQLTGHVELKFNCEKIKITVRLNSMNTVDIDDIMKAYSEGIVRDRKEHVYFVTKM